jgi:hypothetical protein
MAEAFRLVKYYKLQYPDGNFFGGFHFHGGWFLLIENTIPLVGEVSAGLLEECLLPTLPPNFGSTENIVHQSMSYVYNRIHISIYIYVYIYIYIYIYNYNQL